MLNKKGNLGSITIPDFKLYYRATAIKTLWYLHKNRCENKWNQIKDPDMNPRSYTHPIFDTGTKNMMERGQPL
jgi:hypothetical protein